MFKSDKQKLKKIINTAKLLNGIEHGNKNIMSEIFHSEKLARTVEVMKVYHDRGHYGYDILITKRELRQELDNMKNDFYSHVNHVPGQIFPESAAHHHELLVSPLAIALMRRDAKMIQLLQYHPSFSLSHKTLRDLFVDLSPTYNNNNWKDRIINLCYFVMKDQPQFFDDTDLEDFCAFQIDTECFMAFVNGARVFLSAEEGDNENVFHMFSLFPDLFPTLLNVLICSTTKLLDRVSIHFNSLHVQKSLVHFVMENKNQVLLSYLINNGFDVTYLGEVGTFPNSKIAKDKNTMHI